MNWYKTLLSIFFLTVASLPATAESLPVFEKLEAGKNQTVIVYGTSLTAGGEWTKAMKAWFDKRYPGQVKFINSGGSGMNSSWGIKNLDDKVLKHEPNLVFVEFAYNDAHTKFKLAPDKAAENLKGIIGGIRESQPQAVVVLQIMNVPWNAPNGNGSLLARPDLQTYNDNYREAAKSQTLPLVDHYPVWLELLTKDPKTYHRYVPDGTHPNKEGSLAVTWPTLKGWLETAASAAAE